jgi:hypothetical protein
MMARMVIFFIRDECEALQWNVIGFSASCVFTVTCFSLFSRRSERRLSICLESPSLTSGTSSREFSWMLPWLVFVLEHFVSHLTCQFRTFVPCKVTGLLVFLLDTSCLFWIPRIEGPTCGYTCLSSLLLYLQYSWS